LDCLEKEFAETDERVLGVVDGDLYAKGSNFIFGQTKLGSRVAIMSTYRLDPIFYGKPKNSRILEERAVKEAVHEVCHTYDLDHCSNPKCVMYFSDSILETDKKSKILCEKCKNKLEL
jgi:archaemetzincin